MARIRTIKPEFWTSAQVLECSTNARLLFVGLWNFADDVGRHPDSPKQCKAEVFPADEFTLADIQGMLDELSANGLIVRYLHEGKGYFYIPGWHHQRIDKPQPAKYPDPFHEHSTNVPRTFPPEGIGKDSKGKDSKGKEKDAPEPDGSGRATPHRIPEGWQPNEVNQEWLASSGMTAAERGEVVGEFIRWARNSNHAKVNWDMAFSRNPAVKSAIGRAKTRKPRMAEDYSEKQYEGTTLPAWAREE